MMYTVDALVCLQEFDSGKIVQVPMCEVEVRFSWTEE